MADLRSSNPVLRRGGFAPPPTPTPEELASHYRQPTTLTIDDVVVHTLGLFALLGVGGAVGWVVGRDAPGIALAAGLIALVISLVVSMRNRLRPSLVIAFALIEGVAVGAISRYYEDAFGGIVPQALLGTGLIFVVMLLAYRSRRLRATPRMARVVTGVLLGVVLLSLVDLVIRAVSGSHLPIINDATPLGILFSVVVLGVASLQFILDFDYIERAIATGAPRSEAWRAGFGLLIGFVWVYLEMLRLLSKLRQ
ncbi:Bax inhibitor-1/YccA family membrane protein [Candidatus Frankia alpina]|uniref:Bax inhibitor-1/YccA family protein n=1 Tax=Candidatus Frankia alpina TaxID=2699483 RepID=A0A4S5EP70_9ACTN|nr:Bax inhibitor-1/YccA family protein [Candidatus Frankia alpina]THJ74125.1 Bax inhibitor-1/YccA family protein [Candidatus Frankia alpina]